MIGTAGPKSRACPKRPGATPGGPQAAHGTAVIGPDCDSVGGAASTWRGWIRGRLQLLSSSAVPKRRVPGWLTTPMLLLAIVAAVILGGPPWVVAADLITLAFEPHGVFFSAETRQPVSIDPQVFVATPGAAAGIGPQNISHVAGFALASLVAAPDTPLYSAAGKPLGVTLGRWLGARGTGEVTAVADGRHAALVTVSFTELIPGGVYSLFVVTFRPAGNTFAPLDGVGLHNFVALSDGIASARVFTPFRLTHENAVLLVYHSDGRAHGMSRGSPGLTAHHQLIARLP